MKALCTIENRSLDFYFTEKGDFLRAQFVIFSIFVIRIAAEGANMFALSGCWRRRLDRRTYLSFFYYTRVRRYQGFEFLFMIKLNTIMAFDARAYCT